VFRHVCRRVRLLDQVLIEEYHLHPECQALRDVFQRIQAMAIDDLFKIPIAMFPEGTVTVLTIHYYE
jgi:predicted anti-sigma-YlaC factor YlaD